MAIGDAVGKQAADEIVSAIPALETFVDLQLAKLQDTAKQIVADAKSEIELVVGSSLQVLTVERTQALNQLFDGLHELLDRVNWPGVIRPRVQTK